MNITKTLCLCAALSGAAGIQAMENCELVTKQDNTRQHLSDQPPRSIQTPVRIAGSGATNCPHQAITDECETGLDVRKLFPEHTGYDRSF